MIQSRERERENFLITKIKVDHRKVYKGLGQEDRGLPSSTVRNTEWTLLEMIY